MKKLEVLLGRPDFRRNPAAAIWKRLAWRARWKVDSRPWVLTLRGGRRIAAPHGGSGALIYYQGDSEPETADFFRAFLHPGMTFLDVGAHIGEYTILGSDAVHPGGIVHAFEPSPDIFNLLRENIRMNGLGNVELHQMAMSNTEGTQSFEVCREPSISAFRGSHKPASKSRAVLSEIQVDTTTLDSWWKSRGPRIDLIKIDVEGAELSVLSGALRFLSLPPEDAPTLVFEYSPENYARFGYDGREVAALLRRHDYQLLHTSNRLPTTAIDLTRVAAAQTINVVATKSVGRLEELIASQNGR
jgi:FkbM family methyltransferase